MQHLQPSSPLQGGKYKIEKVLGQGGFGITYLAEQVMLGRKVAVKEFFMKDLCNRDGETSQVSVGSTGSIEMVERFKEKFLKEARLIACMDNSHIVRIYDIFEENGTAYYIMENIDGGSVDALVKNGGMKESDALKIIQEVGSALEYIHKQNVLHLDVKPSNILIRNNGEAVLIDFGISKRYDDAGGQTSTTPTGISKGYAPIEQYNQGLQNFSPATDVYSLGATLFKLLTGQTPPEAPMLLDDEEFPDCPSNVSTSIWSTIEKAMEPRKKKRYQSVNEFVSALDSTNKVSSEQPTNLKKQSEETLIIESKEKPKFLKEEDKEATRLISDAVVVQSTISTDDIVDLGLSVKWCSHNLGGVNPEDTGDYYSWSDDYEWKNLSLKDISGTSADVVTKVMFGKWKTPTRKQLKELIDRCRWSWIEYNGVYGCKVTGPSGKSIFLPAAGKFGINGIVKKQIVGYYWSSSKASAYNSASYLNFDSEDSNLNYEQYTTRRCIRPVCD